MTVVVNGVRNAVEIAWNPEGTVEEPPEVNVPEFPTHPIVGDPSAPWLPPFIWGPDDPRPSQPIQLPDDILDGITDEEVKQKLIDFLTGNLPPYEGGPDYPAPVKDKSESVQIFAQGQDGDWSNTAVQPNDGLAVLTYPEGFSGESYVEVRDLKGNLVDSGTIVVEAD